ncbi:transposase [Pseudoduganella sp. RAF53_2]|uniref:transposase n=1 Tax=unclassified Pseudoduganella TaxID=2637179 RepID=UPI003F96D036
MPRQPRHFPAGSCMHIVQRGDNRRTCFHSENDRRHYVSLLDKYSKASGCLIHAYVLMSNHVHLLVTVQELNAQSWMMKAISQCAAHRLHCLRGESGTMWDGRYKAARVEAEDYLLLCQRYIELNPVRAGMVQYPGHYRWSSYNCNAEGRRNDVITPHEVYLRLGREARQRQMAYQALFDIPYSESDLERIRGATHFQSVIRKP